MAKTRSRMMAGTPILQGDNTIPGIKMHKEVAAVLPQIEGACRKMGLDYYPIIVEFVSYDEMAELASYGGFPVRYPHWRFGMEYEEMSRGYEFNQYRISEMVINTNPCYIYCMDSNTLVDNVDVIAHAIGHNDFFKNNIFFEPTDDNMMNKLANHGTRIRKYMARWGHEVVTEFIDHVLRIETLIDPTKAWKKKRIKQIHVKDERNYKFPERLKFHHNYMDEWVNPKDFIDKQNEDIKKDEAAQFLDIFSGPERDIFGYIKDHAPLKPWQQDIISMLYEEAMYFSPQRATKMINEGWASFVDFHLLCEEGLAALGQPSEDAGIWHYADHKWRVLGGKYSQNPYKLGFELFMDIRDRWNKGRFGPEWENCTDMKKKENWDLNLGLGMEKIFEVRKNYNDFLMIQEFFTPEFCEKKKFFEYKRFPNGEYKIVNRDFKSIKKKLLQRYINGGLPDIRLEDPNHLGKGWFFMQHNWDGRPLYDQYARETIVSLFRLWKNVVVLATRNRDGIEYLYICDGSNPEKDVHIMTREDYEKEVFK
jgi:stage V sporulation protein R